MGAIRNYVTAGVIQLGSYDITRGRSYFDMRNELSDYAYGNCVARTEKNIDETEPKIDEPKVPTYKQPTLRENTVLLLERITADEGRRELSDVVEDEAREGRNSRKGWSRNGFGFT
jgi:hypothetical protein